MMASILDGSLLICTLRIASSSAASAGNGDVTVTTGFIPLAVVDSGPADPSGARNPAFSSAALPVSPISKPTRSPTAATAAGSVDTVTTG